MISRQPFSPPSLFIVIGSAAASLVLLASSVEGQSYDYSSDHVVARASAISKDYQSIASFLAEETGASRENARAIYQLGAYCQSYATLMLDAPLADEILQGTEVTGTNDNAGNVNGIVHSGAFQGDGTLEVMYLIPDNGITSICSVAGNPTPQYNQCKCSVPI